MACTMISAKVFMVLVTPSLWRATRSMPLARRASCTAGRWNSAAWISVTGVAVAVAVVSVADADAPPEDHEMEGFSVRPVSATYCA